MLREKELYGRISEAFAYPDSNFREKIESLGLDLQRRFPEEAEQFRSFRNFVNDTTLEELQEYYTRTFDINPLTTLDVSHHIFGDTYKRGQFLANLRVEQQKLGIDTNHELPDYLPVLLHYLISVTDFELRQSLVTYILLPALAKMKHTLQASVNAYAAVVEVLIQIVMRDFRITKIEPVYESKEKLITLNGE